MLLTPRRTTTSAEALRFCHNIHVRRTLSIFAIFTLCPFMAAPGMAQTAPPSISPTAVTLSMIAGNNPALFLFDSDASGKNFRDQWDILTSHADVLNAGNLVVIPVLSITSVALPPDHGLHISYLSDVDAASARATFHCTGNSFCAVFMAKQGTTQQVSSPFPATSLVALVHAGPTPVQAAITTQQNAGYKTLTSSSAASTVVLSDLLGAARPVLLFSLTADDRDFQAQWATLAEHANDLSARNVIIVPILSVQSPALPPAHGLQIKSLDDLGRTKARSDFSCSSASFCVILLGKDGGEKFRSSSPVSIDEIISTIDGMPMRQQEMKQQQQNAPPSQ